MFAKINRFLRNDVWRIRITKLPRFKASLIRYLRIILLTYRGFQEDNCPLWASALTFFLLLSIVPVFALAFGVAKGFGLEQRLQAEILQRFRGQEEVILQIVEFSQRLLANTRGDLIAGIGIIFLFWSVIRILGIIEQSFDDIWDVEQVRPLSRKFSDYLSVMLVFPVLVIAASSLTVYITVVLENISRDAGWWGVLNPVIIVALDIVPYIVIWIAFSFIYVFMPNTPVRLRSAVPAGIIAGTIYQAVQWLYIHFQVGVANFNTVYGSFAALPLFLIWVQVSWLILLFGAELSYAHQNVRMFEFEPDSRRISYSFRKLVALRIVLLLIRECSGRKQPLSSAEIARLLDAPVRLVIGILQDLVLSGIVLSVNAGGEKEIVYLATCNVNDLTIKKVIDAMENRGTEDIPIRRSPELDILAAALQSFDEAARLSPANKVLKEIPEEPAGRY